MSLRTKVRAVVPEPIKRRVRERRHDGALVPSLITDREQLEAYRRELDALRPLIGHARAEFVAEAVGTSRRGDRFSFGELDWRASGRIYALIRALHPETLVETGVCNGVSTAVILYALERNGAGRLWSIDWPEFSDGTGGDVWSGKGGAVVPAGKEPGWLIPEHLRKRWTLIVGKSQDELPPLLERLGMIDLFMHDSEHSYECMSFEFECAHRHLRSRGAIVADDARQNHAFADFGRAHAVPVKDLGGGTQLAII